MSQQYTTRIVPLEQLTPGSGGGKASGLAILTRLGLQVPPALVVLDSDASGIPGDIENTWMNFAGGTAAVRSSGSDEDGKGASAAGQYETVLNVSPENLNEAVRQCLDSADAERVETYERELSGTAGGHMSVIIQKMIIPSLAGVIFTADPISGDKDVMVVEAVAGLGEELVSGHAEAARYVIKFAGADGDSPVVESSGDLAGASVSEMLLDELRAGAALAAAEWGMPLDLEWAVDSGTGELYWLQARPITALADSLDSIVGPDELITRCNIGEMMPGAVTPLTLSTFGKSLSTGLALYYRSFGAIRRNEPDPSFIENFEGQLFMNLSSMYLMSRRVLGATPEGTAPGCSCVGGVAVDVGGEEQDLGGRIAPGVGFQAGFFAAAAGEESLFVEAVLGGHLGQEEAATGTAADQDAVLTQLEIVQVAHRPRGRQDGDLDRDVGQLGQGERGEARVVHGRVDGGVANRFGERLVRVERAHAPAQATKHAQGDERAAEGL